MHKHRGGEETAIHQAPTYMLPCVILANPDGHPMWETNGIFRDGEQTEAGEVASEAPDTQLTNGKRNSNPGTIVYKCLSKDPA